MKRADIRHLPIALVAALLCSFAAFATSIGHVSSLEGTATRAQANGPPMPLKQGDSVEMGDTLTVSPDGNLELELSDESTLAVKGGSKLQIDQARFGALERHFSLRRRAEHLRRYQRIERRPRRRHRRRHGRWRHWKRLHP